MSQVVVHRRAAKYVRKLPNPQKNRLKALLKQLQHNPLMQPDEPHNYVLSCNRSRTG